MSKSKKEELLSYYKKAREYLAYNEYTGVLTWKVRKRGTKGLGSIAGSTKGSNGYRLVCVDRKQILAHRLIWFIHYGYIPSEIDHIDRCRDNNKISNLRECDRTQNNLNQGMRTNNKSGYTGVNWNKKDKKYHARIQYKGDVFFLGLFNCPKEAYLKYKNKREELLRYN